MLLRYANLSPTAGKIKTWEGNQRFLDYTRQRWHLRLGLRDQEKLQFSEQVVDAVHAWGGRFLEEDADGWYLVDSARALRKVSQRFRDLRSEYMKKSQHKLNGPFTVSKASKSLPFQATPSRHGSARTVSFDASESSMHGQNTSQAASMPTNEVAVNAVITLALKSPEDKGAQLDDDFLSIWLEEELLGDKSDSVSSGGNAVIPTDSGTPMQRSYTPNIELVSDPFFYDFAEDTSSTGSLVHIFEEFASDEDSAFKPADGM